MNRMNLAVASTRQALVNAYNLGPAENPQLSYVAGLQMFCGSKAAGGTILANKVGIGEQLRTGGSRRVDKQIGLQRIASVDVANKGDAGVSKKVGGATSFGFRLRHVALN